MRITINLGAYMLQEAYRKYMMEKCDKLRCELEDRTKSGRYYDMLGQYRKWFDDQEIESEGEDGWPMDLVFAEENIQAFVDYWLGR